MTEPVVLPPIPKILDYPAAIGIGLTVLFTMALVLVASRFDASGGALTVSLMVVITFAAAVIFCLFFTVPQDEVTSSVLGGLTAAFGAVIAFWLGRSKS